MDTSYMDTSHKDIAHAIRRLVIAGAALHLAACANLSGLGGGSDFQCKAPEGVPCQSISGVHHNERAGNLPAQRAALGLPAIQAEPAATAESSAPAVPDYRKAAVPRAGQVATAGPVAIRSEPTVIRIWLAPWEDADGDLNDQSYVYLQVDSGRWLIEHNRAQIRREFAPQRPAPMPVRVGSTVDTTQAKPATPVAATAASPVTGAKPMTKDEAIALGRAQAQAQARAQAQALPPNKSTATGAPAAAAPEVRP